jgi:hypothetical protein
MLYFFSNFYYYLMRGKPGLGEYGSEESQVSYVYIDRNRYIVYNYFVLFRPLKSRRIATQPTHSLVVV